jgi:PAS domain S-box-containing protein
MLTSEHSIFTVLSEAISEGIIVVDDDQQIVATNSTTEELFGYSKNELHGQELRVLIPRKYHSAHENHFKGFLKQSVKRRMGGDRELFGIKKDGTEFPLEVGLNPFSIYGKSYVMALVIDFTERRRTLLELNHWANIFNESLNEIYIFNTQSLNFIDVNRGAQQNIGFTLEELKKITPVDIKPEYTEAQFRKLIQPLLDQTQEKLMFEAVHERKDGTTYPVEVHLQLSNLTDQSVFVAIILDISERKNYTHRLEKTVEKRTRQLEESLKKEKELNELKTKFLSLVSHEFKTPLGGIATSATLVGKYTQLERYDKIESHVGTIQKKVKYLNGILNDFLSIERLDSGRVNYKFTTFPLSKVMNEVIYDAQMILKEGQRISYPENIAEIYLEFEEKILELTLTNLIHNAIKYSPENTTISLEVELLGEMLGMKVKDQGIGIPVEDQKHIFNRYFRAENALTNQGTGIGLNIVRNHLENLGGSIAFMSKENNGSTFEIKVPIVKNRKH